jgi:hypothetical protein
MVITCSEKINDSVKEALTSNNFDDNFTDENEAIEYSFKLSPNIFDSI